MISSSSPAQTDYQFICNPDNPDTLVMLRNVEKLNYLSKSQGKVLPNYYFLDDPETALRQKITLKAALNQQTDTKKMVQQFCKLAKHYYTDITQQNDINLFYEKYTNSQITDGSVILKQYTRQGFFYKLVNILLRGAKDPLQLFYAQYPTKMLFNAIKAEYTKNRTNSFKCYRGANLSQVQKTEIMEKVGKNIETLGFLSTSLRKRIALKFFTNALLEIEVDEANRYEEVDYGYAFIQQTESGLIQDQQQVLFNTLCSFRIEGVETRIQRLSDEEDNEIEFQAFVVKLRYGINPKTNRLKYRIQQKISKQLIQKLIICYL